MAQYGLTVSYFHERTDGWTNLLLEAPPTEHKNISFVQNIQKTFKSKIVVTLQETSVNKYAFFGLLAPMISST